MKTRPSVFLSPLFTLSLPWLAPGAGLAQTQPDCPVPTLTDCRSQAYLDSDCGKAATASETSACTVLLRDGYQAGTLAPGVIVAPVMLPDQPGITTPASVAPYGFGRHHVTGFDGQYLGIGQRTQLMSAAGSVLLVFEHPEDRIAWESFKSNLVKWQDNGNTVQSCTEVAHERFDGFSRFKDRADANLLSDEALFTLAYDPVQGIADRTLTSKSGNRELPPIVFPSNGIVGTLLVNGKPQPIIDPRSPKNGFFKAFKLLARGSFFTPADAPIRNKLRLGQSHHVINWQWHRQMEEALAAVDQETLRYWDNQQDEFLALAGARDKVLDLIAKFGPTITADDQCAGQPDCVPTTRDLTAEVTALENLLWEKLHRADAEGCLETASISKCDWAHRQLRDQVIGFYDQAMESTYQRCVQTTSERFEATAPIRNAQTTPMFAGSTAFNRNDYTTSAEDVEDYSKAVVTWVASLPFPKDADGKPELQGEKHDSGTLGEHDISLDWNYKAAWAVTSPSKRACDANVNLEGAFAATGHVYGTVKLIDSKARIFTEGSAGKAAVQLYVLETKVWNRWDNPYTAELSLGLVKDMKAGDKKEYTTTVYPYGIPVTLGVGVGMSVGLKVEAKTKIGGNCTTAASGSAIELTSLQGAITPYTAADAFASAAVGIPGFRVGAKVDLVVVRGEMPITGNARIVLTPQNTVTASLGFAGRQKFHMLDGSVKVFVETPIHDGEWPVFSWKGPIIDEELLNYTKNDLPLSLMM